MLDVGCWVAVGVVGYLSDAYSWFTPRPRLRRPPRNLHRHHRRPTFPSQVPPNHHRPSQTRERYT